MRAGVRDYSVSGPFCRSGESLRVLLFNFHKINQAKKKTGKDFPDAFPAGNAVLFFLPEPCVPDIRGATGRSAFPQRRGRCAFLWSRAWICWYVGSMQSDTVECKPTMWFTGRAVIMALMFLGFGVYFYYDASTGYPQKTWSFSCTRRSWTLEPCLTMR